jgi:TrmH family RNA methyltransferase
LLRVAEEVFAGLAEKQNPQGLLAVIRQPHQTLQELDPPRASWLVALVAPQDPGNIGSILRCIDAVKASGLLLLDDPAHNQHSADPYHPGAVRASMGALFWYPLVQAPFAEFAAWAAGQAYHVYGSSARASQAYDQVGSYARRRVLLLGSEREGLFPNQAAACQTMLRMPMLGRVTSLNLAVAAGVMLYKMLEKTAD